VPQRSSTDLLAILRVLKAQDVDFIVVGGVCAVLQGAPINTFDLDVVHSREPANIERLLRALSEMDAHYRAQPGRRLQPTASQLASEGHQMLNTRFGPLDVRGAIGDSESYPDLIGSTDEFEVEPNLRIAALNLDTLIKIKERTAREKDVAVLPTLRRTLEEK